MADELLPKLGDTLYKRAGDALMREHQDYSDGMGIREDERTLPVKPPSQREVLAAALSRIHHLERRVQALENHLNVPPY